MGMIQEGNPDKEQPFQGMKIYYSGSIKGSPESDQDLPWDLVRYMANGGADVLSEHVAGRSQEEMDQIRARRIGMTIQDMLAQPEPWRGIRKQDIQWVEEATHVVALVNAGSHGVGMELQHALLKPRLGFPETPILCLVHASVVESNRLSFMVKGVDPADYPRFEIAIYTDPEDAKDHIRKFLESNPLSTH